jgi:hypothetical protein
MERSPEVYALLEILPRAQLYLGCCLATTVDPATVPRAIEHLRAGLKKLPEEAPYLVREALGNLALAAPHRATDLIRELRPQVKLNLLEVAVQAELLRHLPDLRRDLAEHAAKATRPRAVRYGDYEALLKASVAADDETMARTALDGLEGLAWEDADLGPRFLDLLARPHAVGSLWTPEEVAFTSVGLLERRGEYPAAATLLTRACHAILSDEGADGLREVEEHLATIASYGLEPDPGLVQRARALAPRAPPAEGVRDAAAVRGKVLFLGGNETQQRYDEWLRAHFKAAYPGVDLVLRHPGWGSNWGRLLDRLRHELDSADAVVLMRFVRTQFGREARRVCSESGLRWFACTGHGRDSIRAAIDAACRSLASPRGA